MTHFYNDSDRDCYYCDRCNNNIMGSFVYTEKGKELTFKEAKKEDIHICSRCNDERIESIRDSLL